MCAPILFAKPFSLQLSFLVHWRLTFSPSYTFPISISWRKSQKSQNDINEFLLHLSTQFLRYLFYIHRIDIKVRSLTFYVFSYFFWFIHITSVFKNIDFLIHSSKSFKSILMVLGLDFIIIPFSVFVILVSKYLPEQRYVVLSSTVNPSLSIRLYILLLFSNQNTTTSLH